MIKNRLKMGHNPIKQAFYDYDKSVEFIKMGLFFDVIDDYL